MSLPWFIVTVFSYFAYLVAIVNSSVGITLSTLSVFVAIEMRAEVYGNQDSQSFSFALSKAINAQIQSALCWQLPYCNNQVWTTRLTIHLLFHGLHTQLLPTDTWSSHGNSSHPSLTGSWDRLHRHRFGSTHVLEFGSVDCVASFLMAYAQNALDNGNHLTGIDTEISFSWMHTDIDLVM